VKRQYLIKKRSGGFAAQPGNETDGRAAYPKDGRYADLKRSRDVPGRSRDGSERRKAMSFGHDHRESHQAKG